MNLHDIIQEEFGVDLPISGGAGKSRDDAIVIHKVKPNNYVEVEYAILNCICSPRNMKWRMLQQSVLDHNNRVLDQLDIETMEDVPEKNIKRVKSYYFGVTECYGQLDILDDLEL